MINNQSDSRNWLQNTLENSKATEYSLLIPLMAFLTLMIMGLFSYVLYDFFIGVTAQMPEVQIESLPIQAEASPPIEEIN